MSNRIESLAGYDREPASAQWQAFEPARPARRIFELAPVATPEQGSGREPGYEPSAYAHARAQELERAYLLAQQTGPAVSARPAVESQPGWVWGPARRAQATMGQVSVLPRTARRRPPAAVTAAAGGLAALGLIAGGVYAVWL